MGYYDNKLNCDAIYMLKYKLHALSKFGDKYFYLKDKIIIIVPDYISFWDNFYFDKYAKYLKEKFLWNLKQQRFNLN